MDIILQDLVKLLDQHLDHYEELRTLLDQERTP